MYNINIYIERDIKSATHNHATLKLKEEVEEEEEEVEVEEVEGREEGWWW